MTVRVPMPAGYTGVLALAGGRVTIEVLDAEGAVRRTVRGPWNAARLRATRDSQILYLVDRAIERGAPRPS